MNTRHQLLFIVLLLTSIQLNSQTLSYDIRLNQLGFFPNSKKQAVIVSDEEKAFKIVSISSGATVFEGQTLPPALYSASDESVCVADFSLLATPGSYELVVDGSVKSVPFEIQADIYSEISKASIKAFYFNRASMKLESEFAGIYARNLGHPDTVVVVHPSAASAERPAGTKLSTPKGWYDAGDYNKYIVNSGISTFTLLSAYETYSAYYDTLNLNIPESDNSIPDILDEARWNIEWMMSMQDTNDGGVYNKTTEASFSSFSMPDKVTSTRYVAAKGTAATLDFAAIMAMTARIYRPFDSVFANKALEQALNAWNWAKSNPNVPFNNPSASGGYPAIGTGGYGDSSFEDEFLWCASELYITTGEASYYSEINLNQTFSVPGWGDVKTLGLLSLNVNKDSLTTEADTSLIKTKLLEIVNDAKNRIISSPYRIPGDYYYWGASSAYANLGMLFMQAFKQTADATYFLSAQSSFDYLLGRNATTYCFVTGEGTHNPKNIHHRVSGSDGIAEPVPGMLVGGPNPGDVSDCGASSYPSTLPALSYADKTCSYSTNEVAINWNAPLVFLSGALQCEYLMNFTDTMPTYFSFSTNKVQLPVKAGYQFEFLIEGNTAWELVADDWISLSKTEGEGSATLQIASSTDNESEELREGLIYIYSQQQLVDSVAVIQNAKRKNFRLEAEDYISMTGLQLEATTDVGGGQNIGYVDPDDWAIYNLDISYAGVYNVTFRHAGYAGNIDFIIEDELLQNVKYSATSDWQDWQDQTTQITLEEGEFELKLGFNSAGINLNYLDFEWLSEVSDLDQYEHTVIDVFPNPVTDQLSVVFNSEVQNASIELVSLNGSVIFSKQVKDQKREAIRTRDLEPGVYFLKVVSASGFYTKKIIKK